MSIRIGDIEVAQEIVELNFQLMRTQLLLETILKNNKLLSISEQDIKDSENKALTIIRNKFPNMGITKLNA